MDYNNLNILKNFFNQSPIWFMVFNTVGNVVFISNHTYDLIEYNKTDEIVGKNILDIFPDKELSNFLLQNISIVLESDKTYYKDYFKKVKNKHLDTILFPIKNNDNEIDLIGAIINDVTYSREKDIELNKQYKMFEMILNISSDLIKTEIDDIDNLINISFDKISQIINTERIIFALFEDGSNYEIKYDFNNNLEKSDKHIEMYWKDLDSFKNDLIKETILHKKIKNNNRIFNILYYPIFRNGEIIGFINYQYYKNEVFKYDYIYTLTALQLITEVLSNAYIKKIDRNELFEANKKAEEANKAKSIFLSNMSHEIRTPLNGVVGFADLLNNTNLDKTQKEYVKNINDSANILLQIINDILDLSKIESGKMDLDITKTDIVKLINETFNLISYQANHKKLDLIINIQKDIPKYIYTDNIKLKQILMNLLSNAIKFTKEGEIELKMEFNETNEEIGVYKISVRDTGIGINENQKSKLFKAFSQADSSVTREFGGTGLGLVISKLIAEKLNGKIYYESEINIGSTFYLEFEAMYKHKEKTKVEKLKNILVIAENYNMGNQIKEFFYEKNISCDFCNNALEAIKIIKDSKDYDVIIVEYEMPYLNGIETIDLIREAFNFDNTFFVIIKNPEDSNKFKKENKLYYFDHILDNSNLNIDLENIFKSNFIENTINENKYLKTEKELIKIIIAEDVEMNMMVIKNILENILPNALLLEADNGQKVLDIMKNEDIDIIFMDIQMPLMDGLEASKIIKNDIKIEKKPIIIALSARSLKEEKDECLNSGMDDFISKPINSEKIISVLEKYIQINNIN